MSHLKNPSLGSAKLITIAALALVSVAVTVMALREFNVYPDEASGTIAPAKRVVSNQIEAGDVLGEGATRAGEDVSLAGPGQKSIDSSVGSSMESSLESSMESSLSSSMDSRSDPGL